MAGCESDMGRNGREDDQATKDGFAARGLGKGQPDPQGRERRIKGADERGLDGRQQAGSQGEQRKSRSRVDEAE